MIQPNKKKYKFIAETWIAGIYNNLEVIGRTCIVGGEEMLNIIDSEAKSMLISFHDIDKPYAIKVNVTSAKIAQKEKLFQTELSTILARQNIELN